MKKINIAILSTATALFLIGCGGKPDAGEAPTYSKTPKEVYAQSCKKCHGDKGEGNPKKKAPALNDRQSQELELDLFDVKNGGLNQSSGTEHDVMEHNMQKLIAKGFDYDVKAMAEFLEKSFYNNGAKAAKPAPKVETPKAETPATPPVVENVAPPSAPAEPAKTE